MKKYMQTDFDNFEVDKCSRKICSTGDDAKWVDSVGGIHEDGCGWAPNGDFCGECSNETCENCFVWNRRNTMQNEIKPCPFCGGKYTVHLSDCIECSPCVDEPHCDGCNWKKYLIVCNVNLGGCGASSGLYDTTEKAIEAWNRRYGDGM